MDSVSLAGRSILIVVGNLVEAKAGQLRAPQGRLLDEDEEVPSCGASSQPRVGPSVSARGTRTTLELGTTIARGGLATFGPTRPGPADHVPHGLRL
jgi:hypothetical protein